MYGKVHGVLVTNYIYGLGGRDVKIGDLKSVFGQLAEAVKTGKAPEPYQYLALRD
jgi:pyruvate ferredoxin oxidoreductase alpha subunit